MKHLLFIVFVFVSCFTFAQQTRNLKIVNTPVVNPTNERRKAVVVGMSDYGANRSLDNTLNDANDMVAALTQLGFEVTLLTNNDLRNLKTNLSDWYTTIERNDMAIFYFAGHGFEVNGENFLIPIDAEIKSQSDVAYNALNVQWVLDNMEERRVEMKLLILDACRDNPFRSWTRGSVSKGLAQMSASGTLIAFAAKPGSTAQDGGNYNLRNGVFTHYLKQEIVKEGVSIQEIFTNVTNKVYNLTQEQQEPFTNSSLRQMFYFKPKTNDRPGEVVVNPPIEPSKPATPQTYYYYIDQNGNRSTNRFADWETAESEMRSKKLYGRIYSNAGEVFVVEKPAEPVVPAVQPTEPVKPAVQPTEPVKTVTAAKRNGEVWNPDGIEMVFVEGGTFTMGCTSEQGDDCFGSEKPSHRVTISDFYIGKYEVTQAQWQAVMGSNTSHFKGDNLPVERVSWDDVQEFIRKLNMKTGKQYRLPTEAEWEYAARGGTSSKGYKYSGGNTAGNVAWYDENAGGKTHPVGTKSSNELGIYDMSGNVWEWCSDWFGNYSSSAQTNPQGPSNGSYHVFRGGSWDYYARRARVAGRYYDTPAYRSNYLGFRLACSSK